MGETGWPDGLQIGSSVPFMSAVTPSGAQFEESAFRADSEVTGDAGFSR